MQGLSIKFEKSAHTASNSGNFSTCNSQNMTNKYSPQVQWVMRLSPQATNRKKDMHIELQYQYTNPTLNKSLIIILSSPRQTKHENIYPEYHYIIRPPYQKEKCVSCRWKSRIFNFWRLWTKKNIYIYIQYTYSLISLTVLLKTVRKRKKWEHTTNLFRVFCRDEVMNLTKKSHFNSDCLVDLIRF